MCELRLEDKPNKHECYLKLDLTSPASCLQMSGVTGFVLCGRYEATTSWCNCEFPYGKSPCLKRASKGKDKKIQKHVEAKGNSYLEQICLQGSSWAEPQSCTGWGFHPRSLHLAASCLPPPLLCLFAIIPTFFLVSVVVVLLFFSVTWSFSALGWGASWCKCEAGSFDTSWMLTEKKSWINKKKEMWDRRASWHNKIHFSSPSSSWDFPLAFPRNL